MTPSPLFISRADYTQLRLFVDAALRSGSQSNPALERLRAELDHATIIDAAALPQDLVTMDSRVRFEDLRSGEIEEYTLTFPDQADISAGRLSILAPIGTALLGYRVGAIVDWPTPGGIRRLKIHHVTPRHEVAAETARAGGGR
jgi:regulator of nucleoside diphosphate kinase